MKNFIVLAFGIGFLLLSFAWATIRTKAGGPRDKKWLALTYTAFIGLTLTLSGLLCASAPLERFVSVNSYKAIFNAMSAVLLAATVSGIVVLVRNRGWVPNFLCFLVGAVVTFMEFLGR